MQREDEIQTAADATVHFALTCHLKLQKSTCPDITDM